jgi:hypothetical protein
MESQPNKSGFGKHSNPRALCKMNVTFSMNNAAVIRKRVQPWTQEESTREIKVASVFLDVRFLMFIPLVEILASGKL